MPAPATGLVVCLALLAADAAVEMGLITSTVAYLHNGAPSGSLTVRPPGGAVFTMAGQPQHLVVDQGHTSNGAAGAALVLIGFGGALALWARTRAGATTTPSPVSISRSEPTPALPLLARLLYGVWLALQLPALLLTLGALAYVFAVTGRGAYTDHDHTIDLAVAAAAAPGPYPRGRWTPQDWLAAVLGQLVLVVVNSAGRSAVDVALHRDLATHLRIARAWQYNLIPLAVLQLAETALAFADAWRWHRTSVAARPARLDKEPGVGGEGHGLTTATAV